MQVPPWVVLCVLLSTCLPVRRVCGMYEDQVRPSGRMHMHHDPPQNVAQDCCSDSDSCLAHLCWPQAGKLDWSKENIGAVKGVVYEVRPSSSPWMCENLPFSLDSVHSPLPAFHRESVPTLGRTPRLWPQSTLGLGSLSGGASCHQVSPLSCRMAALVRVGPVVALSIVIYQTWICCAQTGAFCLLMPERHWCFRDGDEQCTLPRVR
jgi:hypothetical protein